MFVLSDDTWRPSGFDRFTSVSHFRLDALTHFANAVAKQERKVDVITLRHGKSELWGVCLETGSEKPG